MAAQALEDHRIEAVALAKSLEEWKHFSIMKFDEGTARMAVIEANQEKHIGILEANTKLTNKLDTRFDAFESGIGQVLAIVQALNGAQKTLGWAGRLTLWVASIIGAWTVIRTVLTSNIKIQWPWL